jgi:O-antigen/teichoic acid export membrane protein
VNASLSPTASALWAQGDVAELQRLATSGSRAALGTTALLVAGIVVFAEPLLLVFGPEFRAGSTALVILAAGQLVNAFTGSVGALLVMTGHERDVAAGLAVGVATGIVLDLLLIPGLGITGAAIGGAAAMSVWNVTLSVVLYKRLGIHATALGPIRLRRRGGAA